MTTTTSSSTAPGSSGDRWDRIGPASTLGGDPTGDSPTSTRRTCGRGARVATVTGPAGVRTIHTGRSSGSGDIEPSNRSSATSTSSRQDTAVFSSSLSRGHR